MSDTDGMETAPAGPVPGPRFAREAADLLASGDTAGAIALARAGTEKYPWYPAGFLTLGRCHEIAGNTPDALTAFRDACRLVPDAPVILGALQRLEAEQARAEHGDAAAAPGTEAETISGGDMDALARKLRDAQRIVPLPPAEGKEKAEGTEEPDAGADPGPAPPAHIATATVAEIYVQQGQYSEALRTYRALLENQPEESEKYEKRIEEIEKLIRSHPPGK